MMSDVLERMRAGNPVPEVESPAIEPVLGRIEADERRSAAAKAGRRAGHTPARTRGLGWRYRLALVGVLAAAGAVALVLGRGSGQGLSVVARAYAATDSKHSILYYVTASSLTVGGRTHDLGRSRVWQLDGRVRELTGEPGRGVREMVFEPHLFSFYDSASNGLFRIRGDFHLPLKVGRLGRPDYVPDPVQNPISQLRGWYSEGHLRLERSEIRAGVRYDVLTARGPGGPRSTRVVIRADDFAPVEVEGTISAGGRLRVQSLTKYSAFRHLPVNQRTLALLRAAPHPGAKVETGTAFRVGPSSSGTRSPSTQVRAIPPGEQRFVFTSQAGKVECELTRGSRAHALCQSPSLEKSVTLALRGAARVCNGPRCISATRPTTKRAAFRGTVRSGPLRCVSGPEAAGVLCFDIENGNTFRITSSLLELKRGAAGSLHASRMTERPDPRKAVTTIPRSPSDPSA